MVGVLAQLAALAQDVEHPVALEVALASVAVSQTICLSCSGLPTNSGWRAMIIAAEPLTCGAAWLVPSL